MRVVKFGHFLMVVHFMTFPTFSDRMWIMWYWICITDFLMHFSNSILSSINLKFQYFKTVNFYIFSDRIVHFVGRASAALRGVSRHRDKNREKTRRKNTSVQRGSAKQWGEELNTLLWSRTFSLGIMQVPINTKL